MNETSIDCGGNVCEQCNVNATCSVSSDCTSSACVDDVCVLANCVDGVKNGDEVGRDCGPFEETSCPTLCNAGDTCRNSNDCVNTTTCGQGVCTSLDVLSSLADTQREMNRLADIAAEDELSKRTMGRGIFVFTASELVLQENKLWHNLTVLRTSGTFGSTSVAVVPIQPSGTSSSDSLLLGSANEYRPPSSSSSSVLPTVLPPNNDGSGILLWSAQRLIFPSGQSMGYALLAVLDDEVWTNPKAPRSRRVALRNVTGGGLIGAVDTTTLTVLENDVKPTAKTVLTLATPSPFSEKEVVTVLSAVQVTVSMFINKKVTTAELISCKIDMKQRLARVLKIEVGKVDIIDLWYCPDAENSKCTKTTRRSRRTDEDDDLGQIYIEFRVRATESEIQTVEAALDETSFKTELDSEISTSLTTTLGREITVKTNTVQVTDRTGASWSPSGFDTASDTSRSSARSMWYIGLVVTGTLEVFL